ncbi:reverse transcriptase domain-containing protein [Tanacetum coccineum]
MAKYLVELGTYNITYDPRNAIKGQVLADFLSEALIGVSPEEFFRLSAKVQMKDVVEKWTLFTDGASNSKGSGVGLVLISPGDTEFTYALRLNFTSTNNEAEYKALLAGLRLAAKMKVNEARGAKDTLGILFWGVLCLEDCKTSAFTISASSFWRRCVGNSLVYLFLCSLCFVKPSLFVDHHGRRKPNYTLGDYSRPSHEGYQNTIELPDGNNVVPLRSDTIQLVQNGCAFHGLRSEDPNQHLKDFLKLVDSIDLDVANRERT